MTKTVTETKPARKIKATAATKTAEVKTPRASAGLRTYFALKSIARPHEGGRLFAHTQAVFELLGMLKGKPVERARLVTYIGMKATCYHVSNGNLADEGPMIHLTKQGQDFFAKRKTDRELVDAFLSVFKTGKGNPAADVKHFQIEKVA